MSADLVEQRLTVAFALVETGALARADEVLDLVAADAMDREDFWWLRTRVASLRGDADGAIRAARAGLARFPTSASLLTLLGIEHRDRGELADAEEALLRALAIEPESDDALCHYARVCALAGQLDKARRLVDRAAALDPRSDNVLAARYQIAHLAGDDRETERIAAEITRASEGAPQALALMGVEAIKRGSLGRGRDLFRRAAHGDVRVVESLGRDTYQEVHLFSHPLMWPLWPVHRFGQVGTYVVGVGSFSVARALGYETLAGWLAIAWVTWALYTWIAPPVLRRVLFGGRR